MSGPNGMEAFKSFPQTDSLEQLRYRPPDPGHLAAPIRKKLKPLLG